MIPILLNLAKKPISRGIPEFKIILGRFQDWWNFGIPHWKSCSRPKTKTTFKLAKIGHFQVIPRDPENFWKFQGMMKFWNSALKVKFLDYAWVEKIPYMLKSVKSSQFQGNFQSSRKLLEVSRSDGITKFNISLNVR